MVERRLSALGLLCRRSGMQLGFCVTKYSIGYAGVLGRWRLTCHSLLPPDVP